MNRKTSRIGAAKMMMATCAPGEHATRPARKATVSEEAFSRAASLFRVVGDVARLRLLDRLSEREWCVTELAETAGVGLSTVSQQLRTLRAERIVERRRTGKHIFYSLADRHIIELIANALEHASEEHHSRHEEEVD
jgi:ArsR family transcriptional regulator, lead/cadmium/zinc/bismuth-responsive transcriptional repressor